MEQNNENLKNFIKRHADEINNRDFKPLYNAANDELQAADIGSLSKLFIDKKEDVLKVLKYVPEYYLCNNRSIDSITLPEEIVYISNYAFSFSSIKDIEIPENTSVIGSDVFYNSSLTNVTFNNKLITIGARAFAYTDLRKVKINTPQISIYREGFKSCDKLVLVEIESNQVFLDLNVFANCVNLLEIHFPRINSSDLGNVKSWLSEKLWSKKQIIIYCKDKIFVAGE